MGDKLRIVFMGSPEFAATCLEQLIADGYHVVCVITTPDRKKGRGQKLSESEVKICALKHDIPVLQPSNLKDESFQKELVDFKF